MAGGGSLAALVDAGACVPEPAGDAPPLAPPLVGAMVFVDVVGPPEPVGEPLGLADPVEETVPVGVGEPLELPFDGVGELLGLVDPVGEAVFEGVGDVLGPRVDGVGLVEALGLFVEVGDADGPGVDEGFVDEDGVALGTLAMLVPFATGSAT